MQGLTLNVALVSLTMAALVAPTVSADATNGPAQINGCVVRSPVSPMPLSSGTGGAPGPWHSKVLVKRAMVQVLDPATRSAYGLVPGKPYPEGPEVLQAFRLTGGSARNGPTFSLGGGYSDALTLADGSLWVSGSIAPGNEPPGPLLCQIDPTTLRLVRQVPLPRPGTGNAVGLPSLVAPGPRGTVWVGYRRTLVHLEVRSGAVLSTDTVPSGFIVSLATDPADRLLYVSVSYPTIDGKMVDAAVEERAASDGRVLASTSATSPVTEAVAGGVLTALPDGVATSFRTGMEGSTVLLRAANLAAITPPGLGAPGRGQDEPPDDVFGWPMDASTLYASGSLWIENEGGVLACVDPASGAVRASEQEHRDIGDLIELLGTDEHARQLLATSTGDEVLSVTAPTACWH